MRKIIIAIDGVSGSGKSTTAQKVARIFNYVHIDSGAMYRAITLYLLRNAVRLTDLKSIVKSLVNIDIEFIMNRQTSTMELYMGGQNIKKELRAADISDRVSRVSAIKEVREVLVSIQQRLGKSKGVVMDGRDIGTVVFPQAELKVFMTANLMSRGMRRRQELARKSKVGSISDIADGLKKRDRQDLMRKASPLQKAEDAIVLDTTHMTFDEQVDEVVRLALTKMIVHN